MRAARPVIRAPRSAARVARPATGGGRPAAPADRPAARVLAALVVGAATLALTLPPAAAAQPAVPGTDAADGAGSATPDGADGADSATPEEADGTAGVAAGGPTVSHQVVTSFDDTPIETTLFLPEGASEDAAVPLVLRTHGWGGSRETELGGGADVDPTAGPLARLVDESYAVLTWDSRGFGCSGGEVRIDDPQVEGRDVSALIDWAVAHAPVADGAGDLAADGGDPLVGMSGGSYAGGIQMAAASIDDRIDALAPEIAWSDLRYSLYSGEVVNQGWVALLYGLGTVSGRGTGLSPECEDGPQTGGLDPAIHQGVTEFVTAGEVREDTLDFFAKSSLAAYGQQHPVEVPTLVMQGSVDTLFDLTDGHAIAEHVREQGAEARFVAYCGGHVACPPSYADADDRAHLDDAIVAWFDRHLRGRDVDTGPPVEYRTNDGEWRSAAAFPPPQARAATVSGEATGLPVVPIVDMPDLPGTLEGLADADGIPALPITAASAAAAEDPRAATFAVGRAERGDAELLGVPEVTVTVDGTSVPLETALAPVAEQIEEQGPFEQIGDVLVGDLGPLAGIVEGLGGASRIGGLADPTAHVFVRLVHRETGEVVNLQEGAVSVPLGGDEVEAAVPMPGVAYTLPEGDHLDLQVDTGSLMHATGRVPALLDVTVDASVPVVGSLADPAEQDPGGGSGGGPGDGSDRRDPAADERGDERSGASEGRGDGRRDARGSAGDPGDAGAEVRSVDARADRPLPVTGPGAAGAAGLALLLAAALRRRPLGGA